MRNGVKSTELGQFFGWELLDSVDTIKTAFGLSCPEIGLPIIE